MRVAETLASDWMQHQLVAPGNKCLARLLNVLHPLASELDMTLSLAKNLPALDRGQEVHDPAPCGLRNQI